MPFGISNSEFQLVKQALKKFEKIEKVVLFGSRAMGRQTPGSDIDLAIYGKSLTFNDFLDIKTALNDLNILQEFDVVKFDSIENNDLLEHISRVGVEIFTRN